MDLPFRLIKLSYTNLQTQNNVNVTVMLFFFAKNGYLLVIYTIVDLS